MSTRPIKAAIHLFCIVLGTITIVAILYDIKGTFPHKNGFKRKIIANGVQLVNKIQNNYHFMEICGQSNDIIFFANQLPGHIFTTQKDLSMPDSFLVSVNNNKVTSRFNTVIDYPLLYLYAGNAPAIYVVNLLNTSPVNTSNIPAIFSRAAQINTNEVMLRMVKRSDRRLDQVFVKMDIRNKSFKYEKGISELNGDLGFSNDGLLHFDQKTNLLLYVQFYTNKIIAFDENFKIAYKGRTIDTIEHNLTNYNAMKVGHLESYTNNSPKRLVNRESCTDDGILYVQSEISADNEQDKNFNNNSVIDFYDIRNGRYKGSLYVPDDNGDKLFKFRVWKDLMVVIYKEHIAIYKLQLPANSTVIN